MDDDVLFRHLMKSMFPLYYSKTEGRYKFEVEYVPKGALTKKLFQYIMQSMCVLEDSLYIPWKTYLDVHQKLMLSSPEMYVSHIMRICLIESSITTDPYEKFINICGLVTTIGIVIHGTTGKKFFKLTPKILTVFYHKNLRSDFVKCGDWKRLQKYLSCQDYFQLYDQLAAVEGGGGKTEIPRELTVKMVDFVMRRQTKFSSGINVKRCTNDPEIEDLTTQVMSIVDASLRSELTSSMLQEKQPTEASQSDSLSELGAVGGKDPEIDRSSMSIEDFQTLLAARSTAFRISKLKMAVSDTSTSYDTFQESAEYVLNYLLTSMDNIQMKIESAAGILELL